MTATLSLPPQLPQLREPALLQFLKAVFQPLTSLEETRDRYGDIFQGKSPVFPNYVTLGHPDAIQALWNANPNLFESASSNRIMRPLLGPESLLQLDGLPHQKRRKLVMPPFHGKSVQSYGETMLVVTEQVMAEWKPGDTASIHLSMQEITLRVILKAVFGLRDGDRYDQLRILLCELLNSFDSPVLSLFLFAEALQKDLGAWSPWGKFLRRKQRIDELLLAEIRDRRNREPGQDVLSLLLAARDENGEAMTDGELRDELMTMLFAGHETTASILAWAFYWIHANPEVKERLLNEIQALGPSPNLMDIAKLPYLTAVCNETLRIYPVVYFAFGRTLKEPWELCGYPLEAGTLLAPCVYLVHHHPDLYPNSKQFRPERFLERQYGPHEFLPFGGSNRRCLGYAFAQFEIKVVLATILSRIKLELASDRPVYPVRRGITMVPASGVPMKRIA